MRDINVAVSLYCCLGFGVMNITNVPNRSRPVDIPVTDNFAAVLDNPTAREIRNNRPFE